MYQVWWERVPNALLFAENIVNCLIEERCVLLEHSVSLPWQADFMDIVKNRVGQQNASKSFATISGKASPGAYLMDTYCRAEVRAQYRPSKSYASFLANTHDITLHNRYIWVHLNTAEELEAWLDFVSEYVVMRNKNMDRAVFILDWKGTAINGKKKGVVTVSFDSYISDYDRIVFAMLASSSVQENGFYKNYLAELISNVIGNDIELYAECIHRYKEFFDDPYKTAVDCANSCCRSDGSSFLFQKQSEQVEHAIWLTQIKIIYPVLEEFRRRFVRKHRDAIEKRLPFETKHGETYNEPEEVELGSLAYFAEKGWLTLNTPEYNRLSMFKEARNDLSHLGHLAFGRIRALHT